MKSPSVLQSLAACCLACLLTLSFTGCSDSPKEALSVKTTTGGAAGDSAAIAQAGRSPSTVCGKVSDFSECDPLTAAPCDIAGRETCDYSIGEGIFECVRWPQPLAAGDKCGASLNCGATTTCNIQIEKCQHYCCSDRDCDQGSCLLDVFADGEASAGVCYEEFTGEGGMGGGSADSEAGGEPATGGAGAGG